MSNYKTFRPTMVDALRSPVKGDVDRMVLIRAESVASTLRRVWSASATSGWSEVFCSISSEMGCKYGCKVYVRKRGCVTEYGVFHASVYGHAR